MAWMAVDDGSEIDHWGLFVDDVEDPKSSSDRKQLELPGAWKSEHAYHSSFRGTDSTDMPKFWQESPF